MRNFKSKVKHEKKEEVYPEAPNEAEKEPV